MRRQQTYEASEACLSKVAAVSFSFWLVKILSTTLGETGGDAVTMSMNLGSLKGTLIFTAIFLVAVMARFWPRSSTVSFTGLP
jgi:uncharacterized membrane-anchored protein